MSPTQLSLRKLREEGWTCQIVEVWNPHVRIRQDLFGFIDIVALRPGETLAVQTTSRGGMSARLKKIADHPNLPAVREAGWRIEVHGWTQKKPRAPWECRTVDVSRPQQRGGQR